MRLTRGQKIAGRPALQVRALLRRFNQEFWTVKKAANLIKMPEEQARQLVYGLRRLGYVEVAPGGQHGTWRNTIAGNALANATAASPISRTDADRLLQEFLVRVERVNRDDRWLYRVGKVVVFGSYLSHQDWIGDLDLAIRLDRRPEFAERWPEALLARAEAAENHGRRFREYFERLAWPEIEIKRYLRGGARSLSLHDWTKEGRWLQQASHKVLLEDLTFDASAKCADDERTEAHLRSQDSGFGAGPRLKRPRGCPF